MVSVLVLASLNASFASPSISTRVLERTAHTKRVESVRWTTNSFGQAEIVTNRYTALQNGMHRKDALGNWVEANPTVRVFQDAIVCTGATYRVILSRNLNTDDAVDVELGGAGG